MTLIASIIRFGTPVVIGDLLVSTPRRLGVPKLSTPVAANINAHLPEGTEYVISDLSRKLAIVGDRLAIGFADTLFAARPILTDIRTQVASHQYKRSDLDEFLKDFPPSYLGQMPVSVCGFLMEEQATLFGAGAQQFTTSTGEGVFAAGTGTDELKQLLAGLESTATDEERARNPVAGSILSVMGATAMMLGEQIRTKKNIDAFFGGGFEIVAFNGEMRSIPVTYLFLEATMN